MAITKADSLRDRMAHAFGEERIARTFRNMVGRDLLDLLTDEARDELLSRCLADHKSTRKAHAASRAHYRKLRTA